MKKAKRVLFAVEIIAALVFFAAWLFSLAEIVGGGDGSGPASSRRARHGGGVHRSGALYAVPHYRQI